MEEAASLYAGLLRPGCQLRPGRRTATRLCCAQRIAAALTGPKSAKPKGAALRRPNVTTTMITRPLLSIVRVSSADRPLE